MYVECDGTEPTLIKIENYQRFFNLGYETYYESTCTLRIKNYYVFVG
jgi:hypothetical protein